MTVASAFTAYQSYVDADPAAVKEARHRGSLFKSAFGTLPDIAEVFTSGSLARKTHKDPINDVDVVIVYDQEDHPDWGGAGDSAQAALAYTGGHVNALLGATNGTHDNLVRLAKPRNHAVKCFVDDPEDENAFTVDAMPAFRTAEGLLVPEALSNRWITTDPEFLIDGVADRTANWSNYPGTVRMLKTWATNQAGIKIKSLVMEVLAFQFLPYDGTTQPSAVKEFFVRAARHIEDGYTVVDPAGHCGEVQSDLNYGDLAVRLRDAADAAGLAITKQAVGEEAEAIRLWGGIFGNGFPPPPKAPGKPAVIPPVVPQPRPVKDTPQG